MFNQDNRRIRFAWLLLAVYMPLLLAVTFHHHSAEEMNPAAYCQDCAHHIHHDGHLTATHAFGHDCVLCQLQSLPYVVPSFVGIAVLVVVSRVSTVDAYQSLPTRSVGILSTRAPPFSICF